MRHDYRGADKENEMIDCWMRSALIVDMTLKKGGVYKYKMGNRVVGVEASFYIVQTAFTIMLHKEIYGNGITVCFVGPKAKDIAERIEDIFGHEIREATDNTFLTTDSEYMYWMPKTSGTYNENVFYIPVNEFDEEYVDRFIGTVLKDALEEVKAGVTEKELLLRAKEMIGRTKEVMDRIREKP